jgi:signal transduction histidine kinase
MVSLLFIGIFLLALFWGVLWKLFYSLLEVIFHLTIVEQLYSHLSHEEEERPIYKEFKEQIEQLISHYQSIYPSGHFEFIFTPEDCHGIDDETAIAAYLIIEEALLNCISHSGAKHIISYIHIDEDEKQLSIAIHDDGKGFDLSKTTSGIGLNAIYTETKRLNGSYTIDSQLNKGTSLYINLHFH